MRRAIIVIFCMLALAACTGSNGGGSGAGATPIATASRAAPVASAATAARRVSIRFGAQLKYVDVLAPGDLVRQAMREHYADLVTDKLLQNWLADPKRAPGKEVSSPWPESIEVERVQCSSARHCEVTGYVRYVTSVEMTQGGAAWKRAITLDLEREQSGWRIGHVEEQPRPGGH